MSPVDESIVATFLCLTNQNLQSHGRLEEILIYSNVSWASGARRILETVQQVLPIPGHGSQENHCLNKNDNPLNSIALFLIFINSPISTSKLDLKLGQNWRTENSNLFEAKSEDGIWMRTAQEIT